jgi:predicted nucleotidyltransferase
MYEELLDRFIEKIKEHKEVIGVAFPGSTGTRTLHKYSDIDIDLIVKDKDYNKLIKKIPTLFNIFGKVKFIARYEGYLQFYAYIGDDYLKVEIEPIKWSSLNPYYELANIKLIYDKDGRLTRTLKKSKKIKLAFPEHNEVINFFLFMRDWQHYTARHFIRGRKFSAMSELNNIGSQLFKFLAKIKKIKDYELMRDAEKILSNKEINLFLKAKCQSMDKKEIIRSSKANWKLMKYIEQEYEKKSKKKLNLPLDDNDFIKWLNRTYKEEGK